MNYDDHLSYTYIIGWSALDIYYYGVRYANESDPESDLWKTYFSSSKRVANQRKAYGEPDIILVHKKFENFRDAIKYENLILDKYRLYKDGRWLNCGFVGKNIHYYTNGIMPEETKKKISESNKLNPLFKEKGMVLGKANLGRKHSIEVNKKKGLSGNLNPMYGKSARRGKPSIRFCCVSCKTEYPIHYINRHPDKCTGYYH